MVLINNNIVYQKYETGNSGQFSPQPTANTRGGTLEVEKQGAAEGGANAKNKKIIQGPGIDSPAWQN